jgi:hypothetical protein
MVKLDSGNVLLKPSHRRQLSTHLKRVTHLGERIGNFILKIAMRQCGRVCEVVATVHDAAGDFVCRSRQCDWRRAVRELVRSICCRLRDQRRQLTLALPA